MAQVVIFANITKSPTYAALELPITKQLPAWFTITFASINGGGFCLNALSLWLLATRRFVYRCKVNSFIVSLCFSDLLVALSSFYFLGTITSHDISHFSKRVSTIIFGFALETSLMSLCCLSYERLTAVRKPFRYHEILSKRRIIAIITIGWLFCLSLLAVQFIFGFIYRKEKYVYFNWIVFISLSIVTIAFLAIVYVYLIYEIHRHSTHIKSCSITSKLDDPVEYGSDVTGSERRTEISYATTASEHSQQLHPSAKQSNIDKYLETINSRKDSIRKPRAHSIDLLKVAVQNTRTLLNQSSSGRRRQSARSYLIQKERRSVLLCLSIVFVFAASWMPVIVFFTRCIISHTCDTDDQLLFICSCLVSLNSLLDPILYFIIKREFRKFLFGKICGMSRRNSYGSRRGSSRKESSRRESSGNFI